MQVNLDAPLPAERALVLAPGDCEYLALADQDDCWYPDKLAVS